MNLHGRATGRALLSDADNITAEGSSLKSRLAHRTSREEIFTTIHALLEIRAYLQRDWAANRVPCRSIAKWLQFETPPDRRRAALKPTSPWYFEEFLSQLEGGIELEAPRSVRSESVATRGARRTQRLLAGCGAEPKSKRRPCLGATRSWNRSGTRKRGTRSPRSSRQRCVSNPAENSPRIRRGKSTRSRLALPPSQRCAASSCVQRYPAWPRGRPAPRMDRRRDRNRPGAHRALRTHIEPGFRCGKNAIEMPWSNGQAEGQINRLKTLKRAMYGRAGPELLRARMLPLRHTD